ncbi:hypothetical protein UFOVP1122_28 [uncultured Caudovirales phage]|uniref:Uncharacterized protein n=1 Tax=uncultured Caudovirales phage TaxID=2100421 RepID=A0A6J5QLU4_9CAUD|nr:hypothetical protein UFOVP1122_28 [uncultured Caudovirales phage]
MRLTIISRGADGIIPPRTKKTSGRIVRCGKFPKLLPSKAFEEWQAGAVGDLRKCVSRAVDYPVNCNASIYRDALRGDAVGFYQAIADLLEVAGVVLNDRLIVSWDGSRLLKDAKLPRVEVELTPV